MLLRPVLAASTLLSLSACAPSGGGDDTGDDAGSTTASSGDPSSSSAAPTTADDPTTGSGDPSGVSDSASHGTTGPDDDTTGAPDDTTGAPDDTTGGDSTTTGEPSPWDGEPLPPEPPGSWLWVDFPEARCRDDSPTGIGVRYGGGDGLAIFFEGGGACFNAATCLLNDAFLNFDGLKFAGWSATLGQGGIFAADNPANPVADWNIIYVPYCTGDVHAGNRTDVGIDGVLGAQQFVGYRNVAHYLERIVPTFADVGHVLVTGQSAGGFGAAFNYDRIAGAFPDAAVTLVDDSGPPLRDMYLAPCLQATWRALWDLDATLPADCADCFDPDGGGISNLALYLGDKHPDQHLALISALQDSVIRTFFSYGKNDCAGGIMSGQEFEAGLADLRAHVFVDDDPRWGSYLIPGIGHTILGGPTMYTTTVDGVPLTDWLADVLTGNTAHVHP